MNVIRQLGWIPAVMVASLALGAPHKWLVSDPAVAQKLVAEGATLVADYGSFQILEGNTTPGAGDPRAEPADALDSIYLRVRRLDTRKPEIQSLRKPVAAFAGQRLHLIQFAGPVKPEWVAALTACGVRIVNYVSRNAYLVYGDAPALVRLQDWSRANPCVQWDGDYAEGYKIDPRARPLAGNAKRPPPDTDRFAIQLLEDTNANPATLELIHRLELAPPEKEFRTLCFLNVIVRLTPEALTRLAARPDVVFIQPYLEPRKLDERQDQIVAGNLSSGAPTGPGYLAWLASKGFSQTQFDASGFAVDVSDSGIDNGTTSPGHFGLYSLGSPALSSRVVYNRLEGTPNDGSTLEGCDGHGNLNAHIIAGYCAFNGFPFADSSGFDYGLGVCPYVTMGSSVIFDPDDFTYPNYPNLQSQAYQNGARISANSWGSTALDGSYNVDAQTYDALVRDAQPSGSAVATPGNQQMVIVFAAGNGGGVQTITPPGTAKNVITVGASENVRSLSPANGGNNASGNDGCGTPDTDADSANDMTDFSSRGPCADGRMKPDLVAPGTHVTGGVPQVSPTTNGLGSAIPCFDASGVCRLPGTSTNDYFFPLSQQFYTVSSGTSHSTPAVAGACALLRQYFINNSLTPPSPAMTKAYLLNSARYMTGNGANDTLWSAAQGMGALNLGTTFDGAPRILRDQLSADKFTATGQTRTFTGTISDPSKPLRVTLAWTDAPGSPAAGKELVNDLDLTITIGGTTYRGNVFNGAYSVPGGTADSLNNVESVFLPAGLSSPFKVTITAANIAADGVTNGGALTEQDFALVAYNAVQTYIPIITLDSAAISAENCSPTNNAIDPGETVTVAFALKNIGSANTTNLVATLLQTNSVALPSGPQTYGALAVGGTAVTQAFSFTAGGTCGDTIHPVMQLQDGAVNLGTLSTSFSLGALAVTNITAANTDNIQIPASGTEGPAAPYPSTIQISAVTGSITHVTVTLAGLTYNYPANIDALLVAPSGTNVLLMSHCGYAYNIDDVTLTFDDSAVLQLPQYDLITSGTYQPTNYSPAATFAAPAPSGPFGQTLSVFNGSNPSGTWSLYVQDNGEFNMGSGFIAEGWQLDIVTSNLVCCSGIILPAPQIQSLVYSNGIATVTWSAIPDQTYRLQYCTNLMGNSWQAVLPDVLATNFTITSRATNSPGQGFYRVLAIP
jgi:hypothetical protein